MSFANKVIVITGRSAGIGAELARQLAPKRSPGWSSPPVQWRRCRRL